ncbi:MAG: iron-containing alcohol dehydrogenase, partial [Lachnospiraceae bacterium]|nr:iron-containing alcohol dehydrogenase [Lachnospiraceae bacterium]
PAWLEFVAKHNPGKVVQFAQNVLNIFPINRTVEETCRLAADALKGFYRTLGMPGNIRELIGSEPDIDKLVESLHTNMGDTLGFYVPLSMADCREIYTLAR